jgi:flagellar basal-body rod protein FlgF
MIRGLYTATSGMLLNERMQEMISNNIANANTVGYKADTGVQRSFPEELLFRLNDDKSGPGAENKGPIGKLPTGAMLEEVVPRFVQGLLRTSDNPNSYAIQDVPAPANEPNRRSYFAVSVGNQTMYTRDGDFKVQTGTNFLITTGGDPVLPINAATGRPEQNARIRVLADNQYEYVDVNGNPYAGAQVRFGVVDITDSHKLVKYGDTYFTGGTEANGSGQVMRGQLEQSNVDLASSMISMMSVMRNYEANQRMIRTIDSTLEKAVSIGRLNG